MPVLVAWKYNYDNEQVHDHDNDHLQVHDHDYECLDDIHCPSETEYMTVTLIMTMRL